MGGYASSIMGASITLHYILKKINPVGDQKLSLNHNIDKIQINDFALLI